MSQTVDNRVVELEFDNKQFEQGTKESLDTIQKLKDALKFEDAGKNLQELSNVTKQFDINAVGEAVEQVGEKFSTLRLVGLMALSNIVDGAMAAGKKILSGLMAPLNQIKSGGWARAMNIEEAKFQLEGLHIAWDDIKDDIDHGVKDTAYGLDAAAKAASQLVASNVKVGDSMKKALRGISGVAAMTNSSYEDISQVFTRVAGQGRVMATDLNSLSARGLNAAATLGEALGKSEAEIRKMVSKGQIDFATFAKAMDDAFGQHAKDANNTFQGALSNIKAALSRIGQNFATPIIRDMTNIFNTVRKIINALNTAIANTGLYKFFDTVSSKVSMLTNNVLSKFFQEVRLDNRSDKKSTIFSKEASINFYNLTEAIKVGFTNILKLLVSVKNAWNKVFTGSASENIQKITSGLLKLAKALSPTKAALHGIENVFTALFTVLKTLGNVIGALVSKVGLPLINVFARIINIALGLVGVILDIVFAIGKLIANSTIVKNVINTVINVFNSLKHKLTDTSSVIGKVTTALANGFKMVATIVAVVLYAAITAIIALFDKLRSIDFSVFLNGVNNIKIFVVDLITYVKQLPIVKTIIDGITQAFLLLIGVLVSAGTAVVNFVNKIITGELTVSKLIDNIRAKLTDLLSIKDKIADFFRNSSTFSRIGELISTFGNNISSFVKNTIDKIRQLDASRVLLFAFAGGITLMVYKLSGLIGVVKALLDLTKLKLDFWIRKRFNFIPALAKNIFRVAAAVAVVAASIKVLSEIPTDKLDKATNSLLKLAGGAAAFALLAMLLGKITSIGKEGFFVFSANMLMIASGIAILAGALMILSKVPMEDILKKVGVLALIAAGLLVVTGIISKFNPDLTVKALFLMGYMLAFAASIYVLVKALEKVANINLSKIKGYWKEIAAVFIGLASVALILGKIGIGPAIMMLAFMSAVKLILANFDQLQSILSTVPMKLSSLLDSIVTAIKDFAYVLGNAVGEIVERILRWNVVFSDAQKQIIGYGLMIVGAIATLVIIFKTLKSVARLGEGLTGFSKSLTIMALIIVGLIWVSKYMAQWMKETPEMAFPLVTIGAFILLFTNLIKATRFANPAALLAVQKMIKSWSSIILALAAFGFIAGNLNQAEFDRAITAITSSLLIIGGFTLLIATINSKATFEGSSAKISTFIGTIALFGILLGALAVLLTVTSQFDTVREYANALIAFAAIAGLIFGIKKILDSIASIQTGAMSWAPILALFGGFALVIAAIGGMVKLIITDLNPGDMAKAWSALGILLTGVVVITSLAIVIKKLAEHANFLADSMVVRNLVVLGSIFGALLVAMGALTGISVALKNVSLLDMSSKLVALVVVTGLLVVIAKKAAELNASMVGIGSVSIVLGELIIIFGLLAYIGYKLQDVEALQLASSLSAISLVMFELVGVLALIEKVAGKGEKLLAAAGAIALLGIMTVIVALLGQLGIAMQTVDPGKLILQFLAIEEVLVALSVIIGILGAIVVATSGIGLLAAAGAMLVLSAMVGIFAIIAMLAIAIQDIKEDVMLKQLRTINEVVLEMGVVLAALGVLSPFIALGSFVIDGIIDICKAMLVLSAALNNLRGMSAEGIASTMEQLAIGIGKIVKVGAGAGAVSGGLVILASAVVKIGEACIQAGTGLTLFAQAMLILEQLRDKLPGISAAIEQFFDVLSSGLVSKLNTMNQAVVEQITILTRGIITGLQNGLSTAASVAYQNSVIVGSSMVKGFNDGSGMANGSGGFLSRFSSDFKSGLAVMTADLSTAVHKAWWEIGLQPELGFREGGDWHSPPGWEPKYFSDATAGFAVGVNTLGPQLGIWFGDMALKAKESFLGGMESLVPDTQMITDNITSIFSGTTNFGIDIDTTGWFSQLTGIENETANRVARIKAYLGEIAAVEFESQMGLYDIEKRKIKDLITTEEVAIKQAKRAADAKTMSWETANTLIDNHNKKLDEYNTKLVDINDKRFLLESEYDAKIKQTTEDTKTATDVTNEYGEAIDKAGGAAKKSADELQQFGDSLRSTLEGQMDIFSEFKKSEKVTKEDLFKNIESQINGMAAWAVNMDKLASRGIDQGLYQKLAEMGVQGQGYMEGFLDMTDEELQKYNELWSTSLVLPDAASQMLVGSMQKIGEGVGEGLATGIDKSTAEVTNAAKDQCKDTINAYKSPEGFDQNSPAKTIIPIGNGVTEGLEVGIMELLPRLLGKIKNMCAQMIKSMEQELNPSKFTAIATKLMGGLESGITESSTGIIGKMKEIGANISEGLAAGIEAASDTVSKAASKVASIAAKVTADKNEVKSPSRVMMRLGEFISEGLAIGIDNKSAMVVRTVEDMNDDVVNTMKLTIANIASQINDGMEDPVITPVLDLTRVESGMKSLSSMLTTNDMVMKASGSFDTLQNGQLNSSSGINFIQNNYSPKALSRTDIYRQTNNQLLMLKKVAYNG